MPVAEFEPWVYATPELEEYLGPELHFDLISARFASHEELDRLRPRLAVRTRVVDPVACRCREIPDRAVIDMGLVSERLMPTFDSLRRAGDPRWWLSCERCRKCGETWLVGAEERMSDVYCIRRLDTECVQKVLDHGIWPTDFDSYRELQLIGAGTTGGWTRCGWRDHSH